LINKLVVVLILWMSTRNQSW